MDNYIQSQGAGVGFGVGYRDYRRYRQGVGARVGSAGWWKRPCSSMRLRMRSMVRGFLRVSFLYLLESSFWERRPWKVGWQEMRVKSSPKCCSSRQKLVVSACDHLREVFLGECGMRGAVRRCAWVNLGSCSIICFKVSGSGSSLSRQMLRLVEISHSSFLKMDLTIKQSIIFNNPIILLVTVPPTSSDVDHSKHISVWGASRGGRGRRALNWGLGRRRVHSKSAWAWLQRYSCISLRLLRQRRSACSSAPRQFLLRSFVSYQSLPYRRTSCCSQKRLSLSFSLHTPKQSTTLNGRNSLCSCCRAFL